MNENAKSTMAPEIAALIPQGWTIVEDAPPRLIREPELVYFLEEGVAWVRGEEMRTRAVKLGANLGLADATWFLENQTLIPTESWWSQRMVDIPFPGTLLRDSKDNLRVPCLCWGNTSRRWWLGFGWLVNGWDGPLIRCK